MSKDADRDKRLAEALRHNLRRRKAQARGQEAAPPADDEERHPGESRNP